MSTCRDAARTAVRIAALALALALGLAAPAAAERMALVVPAYQYPTTGSLWTDLAAAAPRVPVIAILDPANGPGPTADPNYTAAVTALRSAGGRVYGYVTSSYAARAVDAVLADVDTFRAQYPLDGIFVDELTSDAGHVAYYTAIVSAIHARPGALGVIGNPGTNCDVAYATDARFDRIVIHENDASDVGWTADPWTTHVAPSRLVNLVHHARGSTAMINIVTGSVQRNVGGVFVTDDSLPNPWDSTPTFWSQEVADVETTTIATPAAVDGPPAALPGLRADRSPARGAVAFAFAPAPIARTLRVLDAAGRCVRTARIAAGVRAGTWNARDADGAPAAPGVYFARLDGVRDAARVVLLR